jgi:phytoene dehydrogenase-like protein
MADYDAIVIGAGHNGLVCALYLARAGWRVLVLEQATEVGGGLRSGELTLPGFHHDRYATNIASFYNSPVYSALKDDFDAAGVHLLRSDCSYASIHGRRAVRIYTDGDRTLRDIEAIRPADATGWKELVAFYRRVAPNFFPLFFTELPSRAMWGQIASIVSAGWRDALRLLNLLRQTSHDFASHYFESAELQGMIESWGYHLDFGPNVLGGATFAFVAAMSAHCNGMPTVQGGAGRISEALRQMIEGAGGRVITETEVAQIIVRAGHAVAIRTRGGEEISASRAVIANITLRNLFGKLVPPDDIDHRFLRQTQNYRYGPGTFIIHLALNAIPDWCAADDLGRFNYVHLNGSSEEIEQTYQASLCGLLPTRPLLVVSQTTAVDPSRAPAGKHVMRIHVRTVPGRIEGDAAEKISVRNWSEAKRPFAERVLDLVQEKARNLRTCIVAQAIESPQDIENENPNFVGGDCVSGSHHLGQNFVCRPLFGWSNYRTPIERLYMIGASTWPGGGVNGGSGYLLANRLIGAR